MYNKDPCYSLYAFLTHKLSSAPCEGKNSSPFVAFTMKMYVQSRQKYSAPVVQQIDDDDTGTALLSQLRVM